MPIPAPTFLLRWRGRTHGPYSLRTIEAMLAKNEIGMSWDAQVEGEWVTVRELLERQAPSPMVAPPSTSPHPPAEPAPAADGSVPTATFWPGAEPAKEAGRSKTSARPAPAGRIRVPHRAPRRGDPDVLETPAAKPAEGSPEVSPRRHWVFALLGVLLGFTGLHNFYLGRWPFGIAQIALAGAGVFFGLGLIGAWLWALIEVICVQRDARGLPLS